METENKDKLLADSISCNASEDKRVWHLPRDIGTGRFVSRSLAGDLTLTISDIHLAQPLNAHLEEPGENGYLVFSLEGTAMNKNAYFKEGFQTRPNINTLYWSPDRKLTRQAARGERLKAVVISFPKNRLAGMTDQGGAVKEQGALFQHPNSLLMNMVLHQILHCRFTGKLARLFLESKALELMALKWSYLEPVQWPGLSPEQMRGVEKVKKLLLENIRHPPSILSLSKAAGMSHPVLNRCFREATGYSVFEFLRRQRLDLSRQLLVDNSLSLTEIAYAAGYADSSHFSRAFTACYGLAPSRYRQCPAAISK